MEYNKPNDEHNYTLNNKNTNQTHNNLLNKDIDDISINSKTLDVYTEKLIKNKSETMSDFKALDKLNIIKRKKLDEKHLNLNSLNKIKDQLLNDINKLPEFPKTKVQINKKTDLEKEFNKVQLEIDKTKKEIRDLNNINKEF